MENGTIFKRILGPVRGLIIISMLAMLAAGVHAGDLEVESLQCKAGNKLGKSLCLVTAETPTAVCKPAGDIGAECVVGFKSPDPCARDNMWGTYCI